MYQNFINFIKKFIIMELHRNALLYCILAFFMNFKMIMIIESYIKVAKPYYKNDFQNQF